jgi:hypothetical protein
MLPYLRIKQYKHLPFQLMILASTLLFVVLFSSGSESPTYIIAIAGVMLWFLMQKRFSKLDIGLLIFVMIFTCFAFSDLFPKSIKEKFLLNILQSNSMHFGLVQVIYELLTRDFEKDYKLD